jgi:protein-S-isoprenylcysteine O-methyltransferase Ste14
MFGGGSAMLMRLFNVLAIAWPVSEVILGLLSRAKRASATVRDRGSFTLIWASIGLGLWAGYFLRSRGVGSIGAPPAVFLSFALALLVSGLALRWTAVLVLGRFFTPNVAVQPGQRVVRTGVYRHVRHPAYSGLLLAILGLGVAFDNWLSLLAIFIPVAAALLYRIRVEESALVEMLGREYDDYRKVTKRLVPGIY